MPIEFACETCARLLRVPDGSQGSQCECPACKAILEIPDPASVGMIEVHSGSDNLKLDLQVPCPKCQKPLRCPPSLLGTKGQCRSCQYIFLISDNPESETAESPKLVFSCPKCQQLFEGQEEMRGRNGKCHVCDEVFAIELKAAETTSTDFDRGHTGTEQQPAADASRQFAPRAGTGDQSLNSQGREPTADQTQPPASIQFSCSSCDGVMEVPAATVGQKTACPYCSTHLLIPAASSGAKTQPTSRPTSNPPGSNHTLHSTSTPNQLDDKYRFAELDATDFEQPLSNPYKNNRSSPSAVDAGTQSAAQSEFGDSNPYDAPTSDYSIPSGNWNAKRRKTNKQLSFSNVFSLTFERAFPNSLLASLVSILGFGLACGIFYGGIIITVLVLAQINAQNPIVNGIILVVTGLMLFTVFLFVGNYTLCLLYRSALLTIRGETHSMKDLFAVGDSPGRMFLYFLLLTLITGVPALLPQLLIFLLGQENAIIVVPISLLISLTTGLLSLAVSLAPFGIVDGQSTGDAIGTSLHIFKNHAGTLLACSIIASLMCSVAAVVTCGIGMILLIGFPFCVLAAVYDLAPKPR
ncbi:MAG: hypothetical protein AB8B50_04610 [Pirellulaceae bacterium]